MWQVQLPLCCTASKKLCQQRFHSKLPDTNPDTILSTSASFVKNFVQKIAYIHCAQNQSGSLIMAPVESSVSIMKYCSTQQCNCPVSYYWPNTEHTVRKPRYSSTEADILDVVRILLRSNLVKWEIYNYLTWMLFILYLSPLKTNGRLLYLKTQFVPRSKHFSFRL